MQRTNVLELILLVAMVCSAIAFAAVSGCSGPQPLAVAIYSKHEKTYGAALERYGPLPRSAWLTMVARERGITVEQAEKQDAALPEKKNPFDAYKNFDAVSQGAVIYKAHCASCHGDNAAGDGPALAEPIPAMDFHRFGKRFASTLHRGAPKSWFRKINEGVTSDHVNNDGTQSSMPAFKDTLAREQMWLAITYLQSLDIHARQQGSN